VSNSLKTQAENAYRILVVERNANLRKDLESLLKRHDFIRAAYASSVDEAKSYLDSARTSQLDLKVILTNMKVESRMAGLHIADYVAQTWKKSPAVVIMAALDNPSLEKHLASRANILDVIQLPFDPRTLYAKLGNAVVGQEPQWCKEEGLWCRVNKALLVRQYDQAALLALAAYRRGERTENTRNSLVHALASYVQYVLKDPLLAVNPSSTLRKIFPSWEYATSSSRHGVVFVRDLKYEPFTLKVAIKDEAKSKLGNQARLLEAMQKINARYRTKKRHQEPYIATTELFASVANADVTAVAHRYVSGSNLYQLRNRGELRDRHLESSLRQMARIMVEGAVIVRDKEFAGIRHAPPTIIDRARASLDRLYIHLGIDLKPTYMPFLESLEALSVHQETHALKLLAPSLMYVDANPCNFIASRKHIITLVDIEDSYLYPPSLSFSSFIDGLDAMGRYHPKRKETGFLSIDSRKYLARFMLNLDMADAKHQSDERRVAYLEGEFGRNLLSYSDPGSEKFKNLKFRDVFPEYYLFSPLRQLDWMGHKASFAHRCLHEHNFDEYRQNLKEIIAHSEIAHQNLAVALQYQEAKNPAFRTPATFNLEVYAKTFSALQARIRLSVSPLFREHLQK